MRSGNCQSFRAIATMHASAFSPRMASHRSLCTGISVSRLSRCGVFGHPSIAPRIWGAESGTGQYRNGRREGGAGGTEERSNVGPGFRNLGGIRRSVAGLQRWHSSRGESVVAGARKSFLTELQSIREEADALDGPVEFESPLDIVLYPDPRLRAKNRRITVFDERLQSLVTEMLDVMYKTDGVGLSAPQVGVNVKLMVYNPEGERGKGQEYVLINPKIVKYSKLRDVFREGCLSFLSLEADVERPLNVRVEAQDVKGKKFAISLKGWQARIFQHEYDHLEAILFHDRMTQEAVSTIVPGLIQLEEAYEKATGLQAPERVKR